MSYFYRYLIFSHFVVLFFQEHLSIHHLTGLSFGLSTCLSVCLSVCLFVSRSACLPVCLSVWLSVSLSICLSLYLCYLRNTRLYSIKTHSFISSWSHMCYESYGPCGIKSSRFMKYLPEIKKVWKNLK